MLKKQVVKEKSTLHDALLSAAAVQDIRLSQLLLKAGVDANAGQSGFDALHTPLGQAILHNNLQTAQLLLEYGAHVTRSPSSSASHSALNEAAICFTGPEMVRLLIQHGAHEERKQAMETASRSGQRDVFQALLGSPGGSMDVVDS
jgi:ankyrin repeat protein